MIYCNISLFFVSFYRHFQLTDEKKFKDIWLMNEENAKTLVKDIVEEDKIIHEHQLGLPYPEPNLYVFY